MQDAQWSLLTRYLVDRGWTCRNDTLYAPHETMSFTTTEVHPDLALFRDRMSIAAEATAAYVAQSPGQSELHDDLVSLVGALGDLLDN